MNVAYNCDCMEYMKTLPDNAFDLAVVDPPYGDAGNGDRAGRNLSGRFERYLAPYDAPSRGGADTDCSSRETRKYWERFGGHFDRYRQQDGGVGGEIRKKIIAWDVAPTQEYFDELRRVSRNQIIWGGNYFALPPTRCFLVWRKLTISETFTMAMAEYAWTSFVENAKVFEYMPQDPTRFHPTQKPVALYAWIYKLFANKGDKILDTHLGSGSSRIAAYDAGLDFVGCEIDKGYFDKQEQRFEEHTSQMSLFVGDNYGEEQMTL